MTGTPASRMALARSYVFRMRSPGQRLEQKRAVSGSSSSRRLPRCAISDGSDSTARPFPPMVTAPCAAELPIVIRPTYPLPCSYLALPCEEIAQDDDGQALDTAKVGVVGDEDRAASAQSCRGVECVWCRQARLGPKAGGIFEHCI